MAIWRMLTLWREWWLWREWLKPYEMNRAALDLLEFDDLMETAAGGPVPARLVRALWRRHVRRAGGRTWVDVCNGVK